jgi:hypothetical protein
MSLTDEIFLLSSLRTTECGFKVSWELWTGHVKTKLQPLCRVLKGSVSLSQNKRISVHRCVHTHQHKVCAQYHDAYSACTLIQNPCAFMPINCMHTYTHVCRGALTYTAHTYMNSFSQCTHIYAHCAYKQTNTHTHTHTLRIPVTTGCTQ